MFKRCLIFICLFTLSLYAYDTHNTILEETANSKEWKALLHADQDGKINLSDENLISSEKTLHSELDVLLTNPTKENICKFPARYTYLNRKFDLNVSFEHCQDLSLYLKDSNPDSVSIVYVSSFLSSPSSFFGHVFLKLNKKDNLFFSQTVSYAAEVPQNTGSVELIKKGVNGDFKGTISLAPYFKIIETYNVAEQRDMEEYLLDLNKSQRDMLTLHIFELLNTKDSYKFFSNNCATELMWIINVANPEANIMSERRFFDTPYSSVKSIFDRNIINDNVLVRESMINKMVSIYKELSYLEQTFFKDMIQSNDKRKMLQESSLTEVSKEKMVTLINLYYDFMFKKFNRVFEDWNDVKDLMHLYKAFSISKENTFKNKYESYAGVQFLEDQEVFSFSPALLNREFDKSGELSEISLQFFNLGLSNQSDRLLHHFDVFKVESYNEIMPFYKQPSWRAQFGFSRNNNDELSLGVELGAGVTLGIDNLKMYLIPQVYLEASEDVGDLQILSGVSYWISDKVHFDGIYKKGAFYSDKNKETVGVNININRAILSLDYDFIKESVNFGLNFRF